MSSNYFQVFKNRMSSYQIKVFDEPCDKCEEIKEKDDNRILGIFEINMLMWN